MRPLTKWEKFKKRFIWGQWGWNSLLIKKDRVVVGKLKYLRKEKPIRHRSAKRK